MTGSRAAILVSAPALLLGGCRGVQSALVPRSNEAERIADLSWLLFAGAAVIFVLMLALTALAMFGPASVRRALSTKSVVVGGGIIFPVVTLAALLGYGFMLMAAGIPHARAVGSGDQIRIAVTGERWWWRVQYMNGAKVDFETANEIAVPTGRTVQLDLRTADVIHSFWVPSLAGKTDMIPGRRNLLTFTATSPGRYRGQCAEYCGGPHAMMSFYVMALEQEDYARWRRQQQAAAPEGLTPKERQGREHFLAHGCGGCHTIRGTPAAGIIGPDLTHVGGRATLAAATLPTTHEAMSRWVASNQAIKPENLMPPFLNLGPEELDAIASYLMALK